MPSSEGTSSLFSFTIFIFHQPRGVTCLTHLLSRQSAASFPQPISVPVRVVGTGPCAPQSTLGVCDLVHSIPPKQWPEGRELAKRKCIAFLTLMVLRSPLNRKQRSPAEPGVRHVAMSLQDSFPVPEGKVKSVHPNLGRVLAASGL